MEKKKHYYLLFFLIALAKSNLADEGTTTITNGVETTMKTTTNSAPICSESSEDIFAIEGDYNYRVVVNCNNLGITDATLEATLRRIRPSIAAITLAHNFLANLNLTLFRTFRNLELLNVSDNKLGQVTGKPRDWPYPLVVVDYSHNKLKQVTPNMVPARARRLLFSNNVIGFIRNGSFVADRAGNNLIQLDLSHNRLDRFFDDNNCILETPFLRSLNLSHNSLGSYFSDERKPMVAFSHLGNLEVLDLSYNAIDRIFAGDMQFLGNLRFLDLSHNNLPDLDAFSFNALSLKKNGHPYMWQHWAYRWWLLPGPGLRSLRNLDVSYNHVRQIDLQLIHEFAKLDSVDLSDNWFNCDGELYFATSIMKQHAFVNTVFSNINSSDHYTCFTPHTVEGQHIYNFNCTDFCLQLFNELQRRFDAQRGFPIDDDNELSAPGIVAIVAATIFLVVSLLAFLWALRNGLIHRCCHVCLTRLSVPPPRNSRMMGNTQSSMTARFAQLDQLEAESEVA